MGRCLITVRDLDPVGEGASARPDPGCIFAIDHVELEESP
jgi:hypothetical protein